MLNAACNDMKVPPSFGLYAILSDPLKGYEYTAKLFVDHRIAFIQLRMKKEPEEVIRKTAEKLVTIIAGSGSKLIINDHPAIAAAAGAAGVHLGQEDMPYEKARAVAGPDAVIGLSTHSPEQTLRACALRPDYIGIGPVYATPTKEKPDPVIGISGMKAMLAAATLPAVVIGGIDLNNLREVLDAGAKNFCMVRQLMQAGNPRKTLNAALGIYREYYPR
ncbi:MAG: thiamine phosphate synthase [Chitinispirillaceae bacterium]|nr:thiamine phosphate synthase [Chitinispirillaceae bacterium]